MSAPFTLPDSPPAPATEPTAADPAHVLADLFDQAGGALTHAEAVAALRRRWGSRFTAGPAACCWVAPAVVALFLRRVGLAVVDDGHGWRRDVRADEAVVV